MFKLRLVQFVFFSIYFTLKNVRISGGPLKWDKIAIIKDLKYKTESRY